VPQGNARYWCVDTARGPHHFRHPAYGLGGVLLRLLVEQGQRIGVGREDAGGLEVVADIGERLPMMCALLGACWWNEVSEFTAQVPTSTATARIDTTALWAYGEQVADEMQEAGYTLLDILDLFTPTVGEFYRRQDIVRMAEERAVFSSPPMAGTTS
jgi:hypothetical protein